MTFHTGQIDDARELVLKYHYSKRVPANVVFVGTMHMPGGLFGDLGTCAAAALFSSPPTRWSEPVIELSRLVRLPDAQIQLSQLLSKCCAELSREYDLVVSFADNTQGHVGYVYRACSWNFAGMREPQMDGVIINGRFVPGRSCNSAYGTRSPDKLKAIGIDATEHFDDGKYLYFKALRKSGKHKARRLGLIHKDWKHATEHLDDGA